MHNVKTYGIDFRFFLRYSLTGQGWLSFLYNLNFGGNILARSSLPPTSKRPFSETISFRYVLTKSCQATFSDLAVSGLNSPPPENPFWMPIKRTNVVNAVI